VDTLHFRSSRGQRLTYQLAVRAAGRRSNRIGIPGPRGPQNLVASAHDVPRSAWVVHPGLCGSRGDRDAAVLANSAFGAPLPTASQLARWTDLPGVFVIYLLLVGIGEEVGWTAFAAPLLRRHTFINAWLILAAIRVFWHLPLMISGHLSWTLGIGGDIAFQFLMLWLFRRSGRVWLLAAIWHAMLNTTGGEFFFHMVQGPDQARLGLLFTIAYVLMAVTVYLFDHRHLDSADEFSRADEAFGTVVG
jgi:hypothetical protein